LPCRLLLALSVLVSAPAVHAQQGAIGDGARPSAQAPGAAATPMTMPNASEPAAQASPQAVATSLANDRAAGVGPLHELSPWSMFLSADIVVKIVMIGLVFASLVTWTILIAKTLQLGRAQRQLNGALARIANARSLSEAQLAFDATESVVAEFLAAALQEIRLSSETGSAANIKERAASRFSEVTRMEARAARHGMAIVATIGATAPFVGLFGTVWGIMNSFIGISKAQTTNLAVVAPGIAEALLATAIGLVAAIPAVIIYNHFSRSTKAYMDVVARGSGAVGRLLSRDLDRFESRPLASAAE